MSDNKTAIPHYPKPSISNRDLTSMASGQFQELDALFKLMAAYTEKSNSTISTTINSIASTGQHLCQSWGGVYEWELDCMNGIVPDDKIPSDTLQRLVDKTLHMPCSVQLEAIEALAELVKQHQVSPEHGHVRSGVHG